MHKATTNILALDVGEKRIGVATATTSVRIAVPLITLDVDGSEIKQIARIVLEDKIDTIVIGYPRNQSGATTKQTHCAEQFAAKLQDLDVKIEFQDESVTSVLAEAQLIAQKQSYQKEDIDALAASIILQDYLEIHYDT